MHSIILAFLKRLHLDHNSRMIYAGSREYHEEMRRMYGVLSTFSPHIKLRRWKENRTERKEYVGMIPFLEFLSRDMRPLDELVEKTDEFYEALEKLGIEDPRNKNVLSVYYPGEGRIPEQHHLFIDLGDGYIYHIVQHGNKIYHGVVYVETGEGIRLPDDVREMGANGYTVKVWKEGETVKPEVNLFGARHKTERTYEGLIAQGEHPVRNLREGLYVEHAMDGELAHGFYSEVGVHSMEELLEMAKKNTKRLREKLRAEG